MKISGILGSSGGDLKWTTYLGEFTGASSQDVKIHRLFHTLKQIVKHGKELKQSGIISTAKMLCRYGCTLL